MSFPTGFDKEGRPQTTEAAQKAINKIRSERGHIDKNDEYQISKTDVEWQLNYREEKEKYRLVYARYTKTVAEQLYSSKFRLIHELLQNADDAKYTIGVEPTITFRITPTEMIVELNERGFTLSDVNAICDTGRSSKSGDASTTGEKGLGFKSVFGIANIVNIQSGLWSFRFEHKKGDDGVGMITPIWTGAEHGMSRYIGTRYRLGFSDTREAFVKQLMDEFVKLPKTIIFALRQISRLEVVIENVYGRTGSVAFHRQGKLDCEEIRIETTVSGTFGDHFLHIAYFKPFQKTITNLPAEDLRSSNQTTVSIAFEVEEDGTPIIPARGQHVFAYLPVQRLAQMPFLIQADFVLAASREAVPDSNWNRALLRGIAEVFALAIQRICTQRHPLAFTWMRFYPRQSMEGIWDELKGELYDALRSVAILRTHKDRLRYITEVRELPDWYFHEDEPLIPDTSADVYLSNDYSDADIKILQLLGLRLLSNNRVLERLRIELSTGRIHQRPLNDDWHTAFTRALMFLRENTSTRTALNSLAIIPLADGSWVSPRSLDSNMVYLPFLIDEDSVKTQIPAGLGIQILHPTASAVGERLDLYHALGISSCPSNVVIPKILSAHRNGGRRAPIAEWLADLEILFWYHRPSVVDAYTYRKLWAASNNNNQLYQTTQLFFPSDKDCDAESLLSRTPKDDYKDYGFLHEIYSQSKVCDKIRYGQDWKSWLGKCGVACYPSLFAFDSSGKKILNPLLRLVARDNHELFVESLKEHWINYQVDANAVAAELGNLAITCSGTAPHAIKSTILPTKAILAESHKLQVAHLLPFLKLPRRYQEPKPEDWRFLAQFGVTCDINSTFYLTALRALLKAGHSSTDLITTMSAIYGGIGQCSQIKDGPELQRTFEEQPLIYSHSGAGSHWKRRSQCVWDGMSYLSTVQVLFPIYGNDNRAATFFKTILGLRDASHDDLFQELQAMASAGRVSDHQAQQKLPQLYAKLAELSQQEGVKEQIRRGFNEYSLIYVGSRWLKPAECLWNCTVEISGKVPLDGVYPKLRKFFVEDLRVMTMNANVLVQELKKLSETRNPDVGEVRRIMIAIGQILATDPRAVTESTLTALKKSAFLPVREPNGRGLKKIVEGFCINDHKRYGDAFRDKAHMLDFDYEDLTSLHPFFQLLGLKHRYMSSLVEASTTVESSRLSEDLTEHLRGLAFALSCCAIAYNSPRYLNQKTSMHELLTKAEIHVCDEMWTELTIKEDDCDVVVRSDRAVVKIDEAVDCLRLFVPSDQEGLYSCYCTELPGELAKILGIKDRGATKIIYRIINEQAKDLDTIMKDEDLPEYPWIPKPPPLPRAMLPALSGPDAETQGANIQSEVPNGIQEHAQVIVRPSINGATADSRPAVDLVLHANQRIREEPPWQRVARSEGYRKLLQEVTRQARQIPQQSGVLLDLSEIDDALDEMGVAMNYENLMWNLSGGSTFEENAQIGAAGELFVYERLRALGVNDFTIDNWQSRIRHYVRVHPEYDNMDDWAGPEVSDIMYTGSCPRLTQFLIESSQPHQHPAFLDRSLSRPVNIHLEVKTSTGPCATPFFMSQNQYRLMRQKACEPDATDTPTDLYVVLRVYNLLSSHISVKAYINPWYLRDDILEFVADPWKVVPARD